jgi:hypothetical protein
MQIWARAIDSAVRHAFNFETASIDLAHALRLPRRSEENKNTKGRE